MTQSEISSIEYKRSNDNIKSIYLFKEGNFYRGYELSAYYAHFFNEKLNDEEKLKPIRENNTNFEDGIIKIGFPFKNESSLNKYFPDAKINKLEDNILCIKMSNESFNDITIDNYKEKCSEWKNNFDFTKPKKKNKAEQFDKKSPKINTIYNNLTSFTNIMKKIITYDTYGKDEEDLRSFIYDLKEMYSSLV